MRAVVQRLAGGRLHLSDGPIDVVLKAWGPDAAVAAAERAAARRFADILDELCREIAVLRTPVAAAGPAELPIPPFVQAARPASAGLPSSPVGRRMLFACRPFAERFVTPMAAVAGAVADELLAVMRASGPIVRAFVNDGGDIAVWCGPGEAMEVGIAGTFGGAADALPRGSGTVRVAHGDGIGGIATSGARGRSFSLGIADSVTVLAGDAATADAAATLIANAVDAVHPAVARQPARTLDPDSDLGEHLATVSVGALDDATIRAALRRGAGTAETFLRRGVILGAMLTLKERSLLVGRTQLQTRMAS